MLELLVTSFPVIIQHYLLRRRSEAMTVYNMKTAVFIWLALAFLLFLTVFYYHPKSYSGIVPFRTVSVVAQTTGPVTKVFVKNGQRVKKGDLLFQIENATQKATLEQALTKLQSVDAAEVKAKRAIKVAEANVDGAKANVAKIKERLKDAEALLAKGVGRENRVVSLRFSAQAADAALVAAHAQLDVARAEVTDVNPAARKSAKAAYETARVALAKTEVSAFAQGTVTQLALSVGSPASQLIIAPAMVIIPDRDKGVPVRVVAGFPQVASSVLRVGMPVEIACDSNVSISMNNGIMAARVAAIQPAIAAGQITPGGNLIELDTRLKRGTVLVFLELVYKDHEPLLLDGSGCLVQAYTNNLHGFVGHAIGATGIIKAFLLRIKAWGILVTGVGLAGGKH